ncbi:2-iminobutanoate/2-iminopropanoate deaminase [Pandoraea terrae]|uniref:2-iminobutanoate/2-iminopropanoate deaminase n=1 Tax=Pandoraea terrae TaxID=1537710 RepID=A0A5E4RWA9_9BURK|nr:2-iminobutanoate/2-iminopropanoate deaminase [Pandoraea terrae]
MGKGPNRELDEIFGRQEFEIFPGCHSNGRAGMKRAMANVAMLLSEASSKLEDICKITIYQIDVIALTSSPA